ncbi:MAG: response regulator [Dehalococcoidia bacterium]|nr:response regulator [Dehalococcoidia bacterium]
MTRILCVEDDDNNLDLLQRRLTRSGFEVTVAMDGLEGVAAAISAPPDLIVMDLNLPAIDGWEATRRLKSRPETKQIPIIALSAHAMEEHREKALAAGCDEFEAKPLNFEALLAKIRAILGRSAPP